MLPHEPETIEEMRARYPAAVADIYDVESLGTVRPPGMQRRHVFDYTDGLRLIVSTDRLSDGQVVSHFSASVAPGLPLYAMLVEKTTTPLAYLYLCVSRWQELSCDVCPVCEYLGPLSQAGSHHWIVRRPKGPRYE